MTKTIEVTRVTNDLFIAKSGERFSYRKLELHLSLGFTFVVVADRMLENRTSWAIRPQSVR